MVALRKSLDADDQVGMDESAVIDNPEVEQALEERQRAKEELAQYRLAYSNADKRAKAVVEALALADPADEETPIVVRVTRFRITKRFVKGRSISFETKSRVQLSIGLADEEGEDVVEPTADDAAEESAAAARLAHEEAFKPHLLPSDGESSSDEESPA